VSAILLMLMLGFVEFGATAVLIDFQVDRERIIKELCVQRDLMPDMQTCKGNCVLSKKLQAAEEGPDHPMDLTLFEYSAIAEYEETVEFTIPVLGVLNIAQFDELSGYPTLIGAVPWLA